MTGEEFMTLVRRMRAKQKEYFRTRSSVALRESKQLEREVDRLLAEDRDGQGDLFGEGNTADV